MVDQLSAQDWLDQGLRTLAKSGFTALKAEPLSKAMGVSRGSFYWHFADIGAFHAALLKHWREVTAEQVIADLEGIRGEQDALSVLLGRAFSGRLTLERAVRNWATFDAGAREAVQAIDRRRVGYIEDLLREAGVPDESACARAQILYWSFVGLATSDQPLPKSKQRALLDELTRMAKG